MSYLSILLFKLSSQLSHLSCSVAYRIMIGRYNRGIIYYSELVQVQLLDTIWHERWRGAVNNYGIYV